MTIWSSIWPLSLHKQSQPTAPAVLAALPVRTWAKLLPSLPCAKLYQRADKDMAENTVLFPPAWRSWEAGRQNEQNHNQELTADQVETAPDLSTGQAKLSIPGSASFPVTCTQKSDTPAIQWGVCFFLFFNKTWEKLNWTCMLSTWCTKQCWTRSTYVVRTHLTSKVPCSFFGSLDPSV